MSRRPWRRSRQFLYTGSFFWLKIDFLTKNSIYIFLSKKTGWPRKNHKISQFSFPYIDCPYLPKIRLFVTEVYSFDPYLSIDTFFVHIVGILNVLYKRESNQREKPRNVRFFLRSSETSFKNLANVHFKAFDLKTGEYSEKAQWIWQFLWNNSIFTLGVSCDSKGTLCIISEGFEGIQRPRRHIIQGADACTGFFYRNKTFFGIRNKTFPKKGTQLLKSERFFVLFS